MCIIWINLNKVYLLNSTYNQERYSLCFSGGITLSYYTLKLGFIPLLITYGVMQGFGFGFGYSATIAASIAVS